MFCPNCGKELPDDSVFCEHCGSRVDEDPGVGQEAEPVSQPVQQQVPPMPQQTPLQAPPSPQPSPEQASPQAPEKASKESSEGNKMQPVIIAVLVVAIVAVLGGGFYFTKMRKDKSESTETNPVDVMITEAMQTEEKAEAQAEAKAEAKEETKAETKEETKEESATEKADAESKTEVAQESQKDQETPQEKADTEVKEDGTSTEKTEAAATTETVESSDDGINPDYNPATYAVSGGTWEVLQSGERVYSLANGTPVSNCWVEEKGKYYYVDFTGCLMKDNYTADGFYVKDDGSWDKSVKQRKDDVEALSGQTYGTDPTLVIDIKNYSDGSTYGSAVRTYSFGYSETFNVMPLGNSTYLLEGKDDFNSGFLMSVSEDQKTLKVSGLGTTEVYEAK